MMATLQPDNSSLLPLLETLEDPNSSAAEQTDAYLTITERLSVEDGRSFLPAVVNHFTRLGKVFQSHISSQNPELSQASLQALGFCVFHSNVVSGISENLMEELLSALITLVAKTTDKNTCTRALWVMGKQNFPAGVVVCKVPEILKTMEILHTKDDVQSVTVEHEMLNVIIRLLEQTPAPMGEGAVQWAKLVVPLVVHSASKVRLRAAAGLELGLPLLLQKQEEMAAIIEPMMSSKLIPEMQKLFSSKNESNVLKLWPLFVKLLGKVLHRGGPFINSLLHLEELGFRSSSPLIKKISFIAWKSLIDNFALNPDILCSVKRLKLLMQPLSSIQVRTEALLLTKLEVWWYLVVKLGPNLTANFEQVAVPLLQSAVNSEPLLAPATPSRTSNSSTVAASTPKTGGHSLNVSANATPRMNLNSSGVQATQTYPSIQLLGLEMLLHYLLGPEVPSVAAKNKLKLNLEPLAHPLLASPSSFSKFSGVLISSVRDGFIGIGKDSPDALVSLIWKHLLGFVMSTIETAGCKKERQGSEVLTSLLKALQSIVVSGALPTSRSLDLLEATVKGIPQKILGSAAYQVANMDVLNGTPALFLIILFHQNDLLPIFVQHERFFMSMEILVNCGLSGPTSPLAFTESVLGVMDRCATFVECKEHVWRMWGIVVNPLTSTIIETNEVNQGDALEHNFTAVLNALLFPISHLLRGQNLPSMTQKSLLSTWAKLYTAFARCAALVATTEENVCCEELCSKLATNLDTQALSDTSTLDAIANILLVIIENADFSPYTAHFHQHKTKSPHTPSRWVRKKNKFLGNLTSFHSLLIQSLEGFLSLEPPEDTGVTMIGLGSVLIGVMSHLFTNLALSAAVMEALAPLMAPLTLFYEQTAKPQEEQHSFYKSLGPKMEKLLADIFACLQTRILVAYDDELLSTLAPLLRILLPHRNKHIRATVAHFWNATFGNVQALTYPEELRPILSQVKQNTPLILPGFQAVGVVDNDDGQYSSESSQLETKVSGVTVTPVGKRDSLLAREKEKASSKPASQVKLDFGSTKSSRRDALEDEASIDFVFIPPQPKERVLTEHQKEVKRTKRVDIPAMYNNLDASLDTTIFSQFTQSQEESKEALPTDDTAAEKTEGQVNAQDEEHLMDVQETPQDELVEAEKITRVPSPMDISDRDCAERSPTLEANVSSNVSIESNADVSVSSDIISGTPQKPSSRRQSFITLEKYEGGKTTTPVDKDKFTGPLAKLSDSQELPDLHPQDVSLACLEPEAGKVASQTSCQERTSHLKKDDKEETFQQEIVESKCIIGDTGTDDEDIIPNTQMEIAGKIETSAAPEVPHSSKNAPPEENEPSQLPCDSQSPPMSPSQNEIRRSGRRRSRPIKPGEVKEEVENRFKMRKQSGEEEVEMGSASPTNELPSRFTRRSKVSLEASEVEDKKRLRSSSSAEEAKSSQRDLQKTDVDNQASQGRSNKRSKTTGSSKEKCDDSHKICSPASQVERPGRKSKVSSDSVDKITSLGIDTEEASQEGSLSQSRYKTRRSSQGLSSSESTESNSEDSQSLGKKGRRSKLPKATLTTTLQKKLLQPKEKLGYTDQPLVVEDAILDEKINAKKDFLNLPLESSEGRSEVCNEPESCEMLLKSEAAGPKGLDSEKKLEESLRKPVQTSRNSQHLPSCSLSKKGRGRRRSKSCICNVHLSQESDLSDSQRPEDQEDESNSQELVELPVNSETELSHPKDNAIQDGDSNSVEVACLEVNVLNSSLVCNEPETPSRGRADDPCAPASLSPESKKENLDTSGLPSPHSKELCEMGMDVNEVQPVSTVEPLEDKSNEHEKVQDKNEDEHLLNVDGDNVFPEMQDNTSMAEGIGVETNNTPVTDVPVSSANSSEEQQEPPQTCLDSPPQQKCFDSVIEMLQLEQSSISGKTRGIWSPSASPSTSILKKGQKRPLEEDSPSPLLKSRRVSFADPIQHQEQADDIDRRSPVIRSNGSSPRSKNISQQKYITTPTKGLLVLSPRNLHSPGYRSSKKCLISEMSQEPKPIPKDCVYPALVGCPVPVEAVLPQLTSNMWPRGFGQLVRARNIKTVGDLSALTPTEIKSLPIRSPKLSNVKKALKTYHEQQRKGRVELKSFDEMEKMTSEPEETEIEKNLDEKVPEVVSDELPAPVAANEKPVDLLSELEELSSHLTLEELSRFSPTQLVQMHEQLGTMMRAIVTQLQARLTPNTEGFAP